MSVKHYSLNLSANRNVELNESLHGSLVKYHDYAALEARCAALAAENAGLKAGASCLVSEYMMNKGTDSEFIACITPSKKTIGTGGVWDMWRHLEMVLGKTPATDAFLAEVRAQGVEMFVQWCRGERDFTLIDEDMSDAAAYEECVKRAEYFAAQLLQESAK